MTTLLESLSSVLRSDRANTSSGLGPLPVLFAKVDDCGTDAGGFKRGNTSASRTGETNEVPGAGENKEWEPFKFPHPKVGQIITDQRTGDRARVVSIEN